jgi:hypothetical protein
MRAERLVVTNYRLKTEFRQIHLCVDGHFADFSESWTIKAVDDRLAVAAHGVAFGTVCAQIRVSIHLVEEPPSQCAGQHLTECSLDIPSGRLVIMGCTDDRATAPRLEVAPGWMRIRAAHRNLGKVGRESIDLWLWPAPPAATEVLERYVPPLAKKAVRIASVPKSASAAALAARQGELKMAIPVLEQLADQGDVAASASLAEILAFQFKWAEMVPHAQALVAKPNAVRAGNVFTAMTRLLRRAATELCQPEIIEQSSKMVPADWTPMKNASLLKDVCPPSEYLAGGDQQAYETAAELAQTSKRFKDRPRERGIYLLSIACNLRQGSEVLKHWDEVKDYRDAGLTFEHLLSALRWKLDQGQDQDAWETLLKYLHLWNPVDAQQIAPVTLLVDQNFRKFLNLERSAKILATAK